MTAAATSRYHRWYLGLGLLLSVGPSHHSHAQELIPGEALQDRFDRRQTQTQIGIQNGPFTILPWLQVDESFNNNIFAQPANKRADAISNVYAASRLDYADGLDTAHVTGKVIDHIYAVNSSETDWEGSFGGIYERQIHDDFRLSLGGDAQRLILPRTDPTGLSGLSPTTYWVYDAFGGVALGHDRSNLLSLRLSASETSFDSLQGLTGPIVTSERNFHEVYALAEFNHYAFEGQKLFANLRPNVRTYDHEFDLSGFRRSSGGGEAAFGGTFDLNSVFFVTLSSGLQVQSYDDPRFGTVTEPNGTAKISWWPTLVTNVTLNFDHKYVEDFFTASPGAIRNFAMIEVDHELRRNLILSASAALEDLDVVHSNQSISRDVGDAKLQYQLSNGFSVAADYTFIHQSAKGGLTPFDQSLFTASIKKRF